MSKHLQRKLRATSRHSAKSCERWRPIAGFEAYQASDLGRIRRIKSARGAVVGRVLKPKPHKAGYAMVDLSIDRVITRMTIARAVALAFHGKPPTAKHQAAHWDGNPKRDFPDNIRWATSKENSADADRHGRLRRGSRHQNSKLTEDAVLAMRKIRMDSKLTFKELGKMFGVAASNAYEACAGKRQWNHL